MASLSQSVEDSLCLIRFVVVPDYPRVPPHIEALPVSIEPCFAEEIAALLRQKASSLCGDVMLFSLVMEARDFMEANLARITSHPDFSRPRPLPAPLLASTPITEALEALHQQSAAAAEAGDAVFASMDARRMTGLRTWLKRETILLDRWLQHQRKKEEATKAALGGAGAPGGRLTPADSTEGSVGATHGGPPLLRQQSSGGQLMPHGAPLTSAVANAQQAWATAGSVPSSGPDVPPVPSSVWFFPVRHARMTSSLFHCPFPIYGAGFEQACPAPALTPS